MKKRLLIKMMLMMLMMLMMSLTSMVFLTRISGMAFAAPAAEGEAVREEKPVGGWSPTTIIYVDDDADIPEVRVRRNVINGNIDDVFIKGASTVGYDSLTKDGQRTVYKELNTLAKNLMNGTLTPALEDGRYLVGSVQYNTLGLSLDEAFQAYYAFDYDHPAYYWISNTVLSSSQRIGMLTESEYVSESDRSTINNQIINGVKQYAAVAEKAEDTLDKIAVIHDLIVNDVNYAYKPGTLTPQDTRWAHSVQGVFDTHKKVVCEGYADAFSLMMNYLDIPNYYIVGTAGDGGAGGGGGHAWNAVYDDSIEKYMYMDLTWDDCGEDGYYYKYFGMPQSNFATDHFKYVPTGEKNKWLYALNGTFTDSFAETYYNRGGFYCDTDDYSAFAKKINTKIHRFGTMVSYLTDTEAVMDNVYSSLVGSSGGFGYYTTKYENKDYYLVIKNMTDPVNLSSAEVTLTGGNTHAYTGEEVKPAVESVICNGIKLIKGLNYTVSYDSNVDVGTNTAKAIVTGQMRFSGTAETTFSISASAISDKMVTLSDTEFTYNGSSQKPSVTVTKNGTPLIENTDYTVSYSDDTTNAGDKSCTVTAKGEYAGTVVKKFVIKKAAGEIGYSTTEINKIIGDADFTNDLSKTGDGSVTYKSDKTGVASVNASTGVVSINEIGQATITATVKDGVNFTYGVKTASYVLNVKKTPSSIENAPAANTLTYTGYPQKLVTAGTASGGTVYYRVGTSGEFTDSIPEMTDAGTYPVYYKVVGDADHGDTDILGPVTATISKTDSEKTDAPLYSLNGATVSFKAGYYEFSGTPIIPDISDFEVTLSGNTLTPGTDYELDSYGNNTDVGNGTISFKGKGYYEGKAAGTFVITEKKYLVQCIDGDKTYECEVFYGGNYGDLIIPEKTGYVFGGWYTEESGGELIDKYTDVTENPILTLYARWNAKILLVTLDANGGTCSKESISVKYGGTYSTLPEPSKEGYLFDGWFTGNTKNSREIKKTDTVEITEDITLTALYTKIINVTRITLDKKAVTLIPGQTVSLNAKIQPVNATFNELTWKSSDESVAAVDGNGTVTALKEGTAVIKVLSADEEHSASCRIDVVTKVSEEYVIASGRKMTVIHDLVTDRYMTSNGEEVFMISDKDGSEVSSGGYQFTSKRIKPGEGTYVIFNGILYTYRTDYTTHYRNNMRLGISTAVVKWKQNSKPYEEGVRKTMVPFEIKPREVTSNMVNARAKNYRLRRITITADGVNMKPRKNDYSYTLSENGIVIDFKNNYSGSVFMRYEPDWGMLLP